MQTPPPGGVCIDAMIQSRNPPAPTIDAPYHPTPDHARRFGGVARIYGDAGLARLAAAHVAVVGLGGVGSWTVEALARSGVGRLTLIDLDHVSTSNINRQLHALDSTVGAAKAAAMARRVRDINPDLVVDAVEEFVEAGNAGVLLPAGRHDFVVDAIDDVRAKTALIAHCDEVGTPLVTIGGAGGRTDPTRVRVSDLAHTLHEPMLAKVRKNLRQQHGFARSPRTTFGIAAVYSEQPMTGAEADDIEPQDGLGLNCAGYGSLVTVTAVFGFVAAGLVVERLARDR
jgi:tRNA A37 threonylcarbamoyladenosine dehydratase